MEYTASTLAAELKRQIIMQLPPRPLVGGGYHYFQLKASVEAEISGEVFYDAFEAVLLGLRSACPEWAVDLEGSHDNLKATFTR